MAGSTERDPARKRWLQCELVGEGLDSDAGATLPVGVEHEKPVSPSLNRPYR